MWASVYRLRERGIRLPRPHEPVQGNLLMVEETAAEVPELTARLADNGRELLPPLRRAKVTRISRNGLVITGTEVTSWVPGSIKAKRTSHRQTWWVAVWTEDLAQAYESADPLEVISDDFNGLAPTVRTAAGRLGPAG